MLILEKGPLDNNSFTSRCNHFHYFIQLADTDDAWSPQIQKCSTYLQVTLTSMHDVKYCCAMGLFSKGVLRWGFMVPTD